MKVAVLMATYNGETFITKQLKTIIDQNVVNVEIFVSDDVSSDQTVEIIRRSALADQRIHLISTNLKYGGAAQNFLGLVQAVDISGFDFVAFADQDDIWFPCKLFDAVNEITKSGCGGFSSDVIAYWPRQNKKKLLKKSYPQTAVDFWYESPGPGCSQVFTRSSFESFRSFVCANACLLKDVEYHDWLVYAYYRYNNFGWVISSCPNMYYVQHDNNQIGANSGYHSLMVRLGMIRSRWYRRQVDIIYKAVTGCDSSIINFNFFVRHVFSLRRRTKHSLFLFVLFCVGIL